MGEMIEIISSPPLPPLPYPTLPYPTLRYYTCSCLYLLFLTEEDKPATPGTAAVEPPTKRRKREATDATCASINWFRVVLDESHKIKGKSSMSKACMTLVSKRRWCVTGTPLNNAFEDFDGMYCNDCNVHRL